MTSAIDTFSPNSKFIKLYRQVFKCKTDEELKEFSMRVKVRKAVNSAKCVLSPGQELTMIKKLSWRIKKNKKTYEFKARINKMIEEGHSDEELTEV